MHDILEGALQYEVKLMLKVMVTEERFFDLDTFNSRLHTTELGYMEAKDRPTIIARNTLMSDGHSLKQNGETRTDLTMFCSIWCKFMHA